jgi:hypothetical protein
LLDLAARRIAMVQVHSRGLEALVLHRFAPHAGTLSAPATEWLSEVRSRVHANAAALLGAEQRLAPLVAGLVERGIPVCLLKGAALRTRGLELPGRPRADLDVLVPRADLGKAERWLEEQGYRLHVGFLSREGFLRDHFHLPFHGPRGPVELHWELSRASPEGSIERMWARSHTASFGGVPVRVLSPADHLVHACEHITNHAFEGMLRWLGELAIELRWVGGDRSLPDPGEGLDGTAVLDAFRAEATHWPERSVRAPFWLLSRWGESVSSGLDALEISKPERRVLERALTGLAVGSLPTALLVALTRRSLSRWLGSDVGFARAMFEEATGRARRGTD